MPGRFRSLEFPGPSGVPAPKFALILLLDLTDILAALSYQSFRDLNLK